MTRPVMATWVCATHGPVPAGEIRHLDHDSPTGHEQHECGSSAGLDWTTDRTPIRERNTDMNHVVMTSGGVTSWAVGRWAVDKFGASAVTLLFADTLVEDEDLYRFNADIERDLGVPITVVTDGRTPQQVGIDRRHLGNSQIANCSHLLKQKPCRDWLAANTDPADTTVYVGIDWSEMHRLPAIEKAWKPWTVDAPLTRPPYTDKRQHIEALRARGIAEPRLYALGFAHNNCGGACVRAGQAQWAHLLQVFPDRYASWEAHENAMRAQLGGEIAILKDRTGGETRALPLTVLRQRVESREPGMFDPLDWGGCGCFVATTAEPANEPKAELCSDKNGFHDGHDWRPDPSGGIEWCPGYPVPAAS